MATSDSSAAATWERIAAPQRRPIMLTEHAHKPGAFDPGHCRDCARETDLLDHYDHVQHQERTLTQAHRWARQARRRATWALWSAGIGIPLAAVALLAG
jgi:hypothetical protein